MFFVSFWCDSPQWAMASPFLRFLDHTNAAPLSVGLLWTSDQPVAETSTWQHTTLTTDKHSMPPVGFKPTVSAGERPQTYALQRAVTGTVCLCFLDVVILWCHFTVLWNKSVENLVLCGCVVVGFFGGCGCGICPEFLNVYAIVSVRKERSPTWGCAYAEWIVWSHWYQVSAADTKVCTGSCSKNEF